ncbi:MAG: penicillin acylase family protein [Bacteroidales bacterium]|nr:penicillin acylase family protein [Bacteroidales bacterium]
MKFIKAFLKILLLIIVLCIIAGAIYVKRIAKRGLSEYDGEMILKGLYDNVTVYRDSFAIPHIYALNQHDVYMATGYLLAQDRLWQMDLLRRVTQGRISEIFGKDFADTDWLLRSLNYTAKSQILLDSLDKPLKLAMEAFAEGVNAYIEENSKNLPVEFTVLKYKPEKWEPLHSLNLIGYMAWDLKSGWCNLVLEEIRQKVDEELFLQLIPIWNDSASVVIPDYMKNLSLNGMSGKLQAAIQPLSDLGLEVFSASNNWAVSGQKSVTGKPILANDMHLGYNVPGVWYQIHQIVKDSLNVTGVLLPGQPLIIAGHNDSIAWGMTNTYVDNLEFYAESVSELDSNKYRFNGEWKDMKIVEEMIITKEGDTIIKNIRYTHRGPVMSDIKPSVDYVLSMKWMGSEYSNEIRTVYLLNRAKNWNDFKDAVSTFIAISQNINYADVNGNIGLYCSAGVPVRKRVNGMTFLPGDTDEYDWKGLVPFEKLPHVYNPVCNFVSSANNKTVGNDYPYYIGTWFSLPHRFDRINELLLAKEKFTVTDFIEIQQDNQSKLVGQLIPYFKEIDRDKLDENEKNALTLILSWDRRLIKSSKATGPFEATYINLVKNIFEDEMGQKLYDHYLSDASIAKFAIDEMLKSGGSRWCDNVTTPETEDFKDMILQSFKEAVAQMIEKLGPDTAEWEWGKIHQITLEHPLGSVNALQKAFKLNRGPYPVPGSYHTICPYSYGFANPYNVIHGASHRHIYDLSDWDNSLTVIPTGNSGIPSSKHYCDQTQYYVSGRYHNDHFSETNVKENAKYKMVMKVK